MTRILLTVVLGLGIGGVLGFVQARMQPEIEERFYLADGPAQPATKVVAAQGVPIVELPEGALFKFETMKHGTTMSHEFPLKNTGTAPLQLENTGSTCKCTVGELNKNVLLPGEETRIRLEWRGVAVNPEFGQSATFKTNDLNQPEIKLMIEGAVIDSFVIDPDQINLGSFSSDTGASREFNVYCYTEGVDLEDLEWSNPNNAANVKLTKSEISTADIEGHSQALKGYKVNLEILPGLLVGGVSGGVLLRTNQGELVEKLNVSVNGTVTSDLTLIGGSLLNTSANILSIGNVKSGDGFSTKLFLVIRGTEHAETEVALEQKGAEGALLVTLGEKKVEKSRTMIPINFDVPKDAAEAYYPGSGKGSFVEVIVHAKSSKTQDLPIYVKLVTAK